MLYGGLSAAGSSEHLALKPHRIFEILKRFFRRLSIGVVIAAAAGFIMLGALYLFRDVLISPHIQKFLENSIEAQLGMDVDVGRIGGTYVTNFEVDNVTTRKPAADGILVSIDLKRLRVSYNPLSILRGLDAFIGDAVVEIDSAGLALDLSRAPEAPSPPEAESTGPIYLPAALPEIHIENTNVSLRGADYETMVKGVSLETLPRPGGNRVLQLRIAEWSWDHPVVQPGRLPVSMEIAYTSESVEAKHLRLGGSELVEFVRIDLKTLPESMPFAATLTPAGGKLTLDGKLGSSDLTAHITADRLDLARIGSVFRPPLELAGNLSLNADARMPLAQPVEFTAEVNLNLRHGNIYGLAADELSLKAAAKTGSLHVDELDLRTDGNQIEFQDVSAASQPVFNGDVDAILHSLAGGFSVDCRNLPAFFSLAGVDLSAEIETVPEHRLMIAGQVESGDLRISSGSLTTDRGHVRLDSAHITLAPAGESLMNTAVQAALDIDLPALAPIGNLFRFSGLGGSVTGHAVIDGTFGAPAGTADIGAEGVSYKTVNYGDLTVKAEADSRTVTIESLALRRKEDHLTGRGSFNYRLPGIQGL